MTSTTKADKRIRFHVYNYGADQTLFANRATTATKAAEKAIEQLVDEYGFKKENLLNYTIKDDELMGGEFIMFPDALISIEFNQNG